MRVQEAPVVSEMVSATFRDSMAPGYSVEGQREFFEYAGPDALVERLNRGHRMLVATEDDRFVGVIEISPPSHIAQLFVTAPYQGRGIARALLEAAFPESVTAPGLTVTVNAVPDSVTTYGRLGFRVIAAEQMHHGVRFVPMIRTYGPMFFPVSTTKLAAMSFCSFGIYHITWIYWNWRFEHDRTGERISPFWRTFFGPIWIHSLFHRVKREAGQAGAARGWSVGFATLATVALWLSPLILPQPWGLLVGSLAFIPSIPVQRTVNDVNQRVAPASPTNTRYSAANIALLIIGVLFLALVIGGPVAGVTEFPAGTISV